MHHITSNALQGQLLFEDDFDRTFFLADLRRTVRRYAWIVHGFCLMGTHYHLTVETPVPNLSIGVRQLNGVYAQGYNARRSRSGHVFQARFKSQVVARDSHMLELCRYTDLNPCRAGVCAHPRDWRWSSYRAYVGLEPAPRFLTTAWVLAQLGTTRREAQRAYANFVEERLNAERPRNIGEIYLGSSEFAARSSAPHDPIPEVPRAHWQPVRPSIESILEHEPERGILVACRTYGYPLKDVGGVLGVHYSTVSRRLRHLEQTADGDA